MEIERERPDIISPIFRSPAAGSGRSAAPSSPTASSSRTQPMASAPTRPRRCFGNCWRNGASSTSGPRWSSSRGANPSASVVREASASPTGRRSRSANLRGSSQHHARFSTELARIALGKTARAVFRQHPRPPLSNARNGLPSGDPWAVRRRRPSQGPLSTRAVYEIPRDGGTLVAICEGEAKMSVRGTDRVRAFGERRRLVCSSLFNP
jgi:hypothetical protein